MPNLYPIKSNECHLWLINSAELVAQQSRLEAYLSTVELARADRFVAEQLRQDFVLAHGWLRQVLAQYVGGAPDQLSFAQNDHGKPHLVGHGLQFNLSHSQQRVVLAVTQLTSVGVDIQYRDTKVELLGIAERFFAPEEYQWLQSVAADQQIAIFYKIWALKEAYIKAVGLGMSLSLSSFAFGCEGGGVLLLREPEGQKTTKRSFEYFDCVEDCALAVVMDHNITHCTWHRLDACDSD